MENRYNLKSPAVKRLMREAQELNEATETYHAQPLEDNLFEWHFTIRGPQDTEFDGGIYHGRIILPPDYPMKPPSIILLTANGRFETFKKICLSISGHHPESWQPSWSIRTALLAIIGFMPTHGNGAIGSLDYTANERKSLARKSVEYKCGACGPISCILKPVTEASKESNKEAKELAQQINFQGEKEKKSESAKGATQQQSPKAETNTPAPTSNGNAGTLPGQLAAGGASPFPPMMPPPFMNHPMFNVPRTTNPNSQQPTMMPPHMFLPPGFWPPPQTQVSSATSTTTAVPSSAAAQPITASTSAPSSSVTGHTQPEDLGSTEVSSGQNSTQETGSSRSAGSSSVRQRAPNQATPQVERRSQSAQLTGRRATTNNGNGTLVLMVLIGLALVILIVRRLIIMDLIELN